MEKQIRQVLKSVRGQNVSFAAMHATVINDLLPVLATLTIAMRPQAMTGWPVCLVSFGHDPRTNLIL